jgi:hypothetical protein
MFAGIPDPPAKEDGPAVQPPEKRGVSRLGRLYSAFAQTALAAWRVDLASGLGGLRDRLESGAVTGGAFDFRRRVFGFQLLHGGHFFDTTPTQAMSLCKTVCWLRLSHLTVTPAQSFSVTVPKSLLSSRQQTRAPTFNNLDWELIRRRR